MPVVVVIKRKPKKISRSSFACWELSCVNSFFLSFLWESRGEDHDENVEVAFICIIVDLTNSPYYLVFSYVLNDCRFQPSPMHVCRCIKVGALLCTPYLCTGSQSRAHGHT